MPQIEFNCPHCSKLLAVDDKWRNTETECPSCGNSLIPEKVIAKNKEVTEELEKGVEEAKTSKGFVYMVCPKCKRNDYHLICQNCGAEQGFSLQDEYAHCQCGQKIASVVCLLCEATIYVGNFSTKPPRMQRQSVGEQRINAHRRVLGVALKCIGGSFIGFGGFMVLAGCGGFAGGDYIGILAIIIGLPFWNRGEKLRRRGFGWQ